MKELIVEKGIIKMTLQERIRDPYLAQLFKAVLSLKTPEDCEAFFEDVCTVNEIKSMSQRLEVARLLDSGENYATIEKKTGASSTTVSRVNRCLNYGADGYVYVLKELKGGDESK